MEILMYQDPGLGIERLEELDVFRNGFFLVPQEFDKFGDSGIFKRVYQNVILVCVTIIIYLTIIAR